MHNFQRMAVEQGADFGNECLKALKYAGFEIDCTEKHIEDVGITLDAVTNNQRGVLMAWEFKGSWQGHRPGLMRTDTVKKASANAWYLSQSHYAELYPPLFLMSSHEPEGGDARRMLDTILDSGILAAVIDSRNGEFLKKLANAAKDDIPSLIARYGRASLEIPKKVAKKPRMQKSVNAAQLVIQFGT